MLIGELAERTGTTARALRYYEEQGLLRPQRNPNGYREFGDDEVLRVRQIRGLLEVGFNSETIAALLPCASGEQPHIELCPAVAAEMRRTLESIEQKLATLAAHRDAVASLLQTRQVAV